MVVSGLPRRAEKPAKSFSTRAEIAIGMVPKGTKAQRKKPVFLKKPAPGCFTRQLDVFH
jgi:hypothetical protein